MNIFTLLDNPERTWHLLSWTLFGLYILMGLVVLPGLMREKRTPEGTAAWLMLIWLVPFGGYLAYFVFAGRKIRRKARKKQQFIFARGDEPPPRHMLDHLLRSFELPPALPGHQVIIHPTGESAYTAMLSLIGQAKHSLWVCSYILENDDVSATILAALTDRAKDGLDVRLILDDAGTSHAALRLCEPLIAAGGHVSRFLPVWRITRWNRVNFRNHRKMVLADQHSVMLGGMNIGSSYFGPGQKRGRWRDLAATFTGPAAIQAAEIFAADWRFSEGTSLPLNPVVLPAQSDQTSPAVQIIPSGPDVEDDPFHAALIGAIHSAKKRIWLATPYFVPSDALLDSLTVAARRGIAVRLVVPAKSDHRLVDLAAAVYLRELADAGGEVLRFTGGMMHGKVALVDHDVAILGSANLDARSLFLNYEIVAFLYGHPETVALDHWIEDLARESKRGMPRVSAARETLEGLVRLLSPIL